MSLQPLHYRGAPLVIESCPVLVADDGRVHFTAHGRIDNDGTGPANGDPYHQNTTSYKPDLNADVDIFIVVPPQIINAVSPIVLGCQARVFNPRNGKSTAAVVADVGPSHRLGEISTECARVLGIPSNPNTGGEDSPIIQYDLWPGLAATVGDKTYHLQPS